MKKSMIIAVIAALIVSFSSCSNADYLQMIQDSLCIEVMTSEADERTKPEESSTVSVSESKKSSDDNTVEVKAETESESAQVENSQPTTEQSPAAQTQSPQTADPNDTPKPEQPKTVEPTPEPKPTPTQQPTTPPTEEQLTPKSAQTVPPQEIIPPPEEPAVPEFDIDYWISFAKGYAVSIGLELSPAAVECWANPMIAGAHSKYLERDITDCLNCYKNIEDFTGVWVWAEPDGNGAYKLYIGYE